MVLARRALHIPGRPRHASIRKSQLHGCFRVRYPPRIHNPVDTERRLFPIGLPRIPPQHPQGRFHGTTTRYRFEIAII